MAIVLHTNIVGLLSSDTNLNAATRAATTEREAYYELAICSSNISDVWALALEKLPSDSPTQSLQSLCGDPDT